MSTARLVTTTILAAVLASVGLALWLASREPGPVPSHRGARQEASVPASAAPSRIPRSAAPAASKQYPAAPSVAITLTCRLRYTNHGQAAADARVELPLPSSWPPYTAVGKVTVQPPPATEVADRYGNRMARVELRAVPPGASREVVVRAPVRIYQVVDDITEDAASEAGPPPPGLEAWLRAEPGLPVGDAAIREASARLVGAEKTTWAAVVALFDYTRSLDFAMNQSAHEVGDVLKTRVAQCSDAASLFVTLTRAAGIPARYVGGIFRVDETTSTTETHAWAEVYLRGPGWVPVDPTMARFDEVIRGSRLAAEVTGYVPLWHGTPAAFKGEVLRPPGAQWSAADFQVSFSWATDSASPAPSLLDRFPVPEGGAARKGDPEGEAAWAPWKARIEAARGAAALDAVAASAGGAPRWLQAAVRGACDMRAGRPGQAEAAFKEAAAERPGVVTTVLLADYCLWTRQLTRGLRLLGRALDEDGASLLAWRAVIGAYASLEMWDGAALAAERAHAAAPTVAEFPSVAGQAYMRFGAWEKARDAFREALRTSPDDGWLHCMLGWALRECGDREGARAEVTRGLQLGGAGSEKAFFERMKSEL